MDTFHLFFCQQTDKQKKPKFSWWAYGKRIMENCLGFWFPFDVSMNLCPCLHVTNISLFLHVSMCMSPFFHVSIHVSMSPCLHVPRIRQAQNGTNEKRQLLFVGCKQKMETENFRLFAENRNIKGKFVFLGRQTMNGNRRLLFQQTCPSMPLSILSAFSLCPSFDHSFYSSSISSQYIPLFLSVPLLLYLALSFPASTPPPSLPTSFPQSLSHHFLITFSIPLSIPLLFPL